MASGVSQHLGDVPKYELGHGQAVLVQHVMGGNGMGKSRSSAISSLKRPEGDVTEHAKEREAEAYSIATPRPGDDASGGIQGGNAGFVRKALVEKENDKKEAVAATSTLLGQIKSALGSFSWGDSRDLSPRSRWLQEETDRKTYEIQLRREQEEAKQQRREQKEQEEYARAKEEYDKTYPPQLGSPSETSRQRGRSSRRRSQTGTRVQSATTPRRSISKQPSPDMGEQSDRERIRQAVFRHALAT